MAELTITNNTLRYGGRVYPIHNLTQTYVQERERLPRFNLFFILLCLALAWLRISVIVTAHSGAS
ncbi:hypothetical protein [Janthinobacterium sp. CAN_S7]|uniref:hypothetical protein n=1 Tax=Janthinobacterium sp. CAN_S7 TaxID=3071704 RepID=UPI00319DF554